jgi:hypothetical protein
MKWSATPSAIYEVFTVTSDTEDVKGLLGKGNVVSPAFGMAYICEPDNTHAYRGALNETKYPVLTVDSSNNSAVNNGYVVVDNAAPMTRARTLKFYVPAEGFHVFNFQLAGALRPNWLAHAKAKSGSSYCHSFGGTRIAEYMAFSVALSNDVRSAIYAALRTKWFDATNRVMTVRNLAVAPGASLAVKWQDVAVANRLTVGGTLKVDAVSAAALALPAAGAQVDGALKVGAGAAVEVGVLEDGTLGGVSAASLTLAGGGVVTLANAAAIRPAMGEYPVLVTSGGPLDPQPSALDWSVDVGAMRKVSARIVVHEDGIYVRLDPKGFSFTIR